MAKKSKKKKPVADYAINIAEDLMPGVFKDWVTDQIEPMIIIKLPEGKNGEKPGNLLPVIYTTLDHNTQLGMIRQVSRMLEADTIMAHHENVLEEARSRFKAAKKKVTVKKKRKR